jgi:transcriptional regulator with XRE-family HTH domain
VIDGGDTWSEYLRRMTRRPGWSVAKLSRESGIAKSSLFKWITNGAGETITIESVYRVADALGDDRANALKAAGNLPPERDEEIDLILNSDRSERTKALMLERLMRRREEERQRRLDDLRFVIEGDPEQQAG